MNQEIDKTSEISAAPMKPFDKSVDFINREVVDYASKEGPAGAYQAVSQAMAHVMQDATMGVQNLTALTNAAAAVIMQKAAQDAATDQTQQAQALLKLVAELYGPSGPLMQQKTYLAALGKATGSIVNDFPKGASQ